MNRFGQAAAWHHQDTTIGNIVFHIGPEIMVPSCSEGFVMLACALCNNSVIDFRQLMGMNILELSITIISFVMERLFQLSRNTLAG